MKAQFFQLLCSYRQLSPILNWYSDFSGKELLPNEGSAMLEGFFSPVSPRPQSHFITTAKCQHHLLSSPFWLWRSALSRLSSISWDTFTSSLNSSNPSLKTNQYLLMNTTLSQVSQNLFSWFIKLSVFLFAPTFAKFMKPPQLGM